MTRSYTVIDEDGAQIAFAVIRDGHGEFHVPGHVSGRLTLSPCDQGLDEGEEEVPRPRSRTRD
jgi:hypothetical protein